MKVFQINSVCGIRSTGRICTDLAEVLRLQGHESIIAYGRESVPEKYKDISYRIGTDFGVKINALKARIFDNEGFNAKRATRKLINQIKKYDPDVIHLHNLHGYYLNIEILFDYLKKSDKPVVWTLHDCWAFTGHCSYFDFVGCDKWQTECSKCPQKKGYPTSKCRDRSKKNYFQKKAAFTGVRNLTIVTPSKWLKDMVKLSFLKEYEVEVIPNGIDLTVFKPSPSDFRERYGIVNKKIILGVASVWDKRKGLQDFIELSKILDDEYKIVLVGLTEKQKKSLPESIIGITKTNNVKELAEIYTAADVFFNPSVEETMGLTTVEAFACGTPAITSNKTAVPEVVTENSGIVLDDLNTEQVVSVISRIKKENFTPIETANCYEKSKQFDKCIKEYEHLIV